MARILIIEDNPANLELMAYLLNAFNHQVLRAMGGEQGLAMARRETPDLIVCDMHMPEMDGYAVGRQAKADPALRHIPLIAVTALAMVGDRDRVLTAGFDGYLAKPIDPEMFVSSLEAFLPASLSSGPLRVAPPTSTPMSTPKRHSAQRAVILVVDDHPVNLSLQRHILEPAGYTVLTAHTVGEGLEVSRQSHPDLIVSDVYMAEGGGFEFLKTLKSDRQLADIPILLITSLHHDESSRRQGLALGAVQYLFRPLDPEIFLAEVEACLRNRPQA